MWSQRKLDNENQDSGFSASVAIQCTNELRWIAEQEAAVALELLKDMHIAAIDVLRAEPSEMDSARVALLNVGLRYMASDLDG